MTHDDLDRRIQDELDGVATAEERAELLRSLEESPAARDRYDEMKAVFRMLDRVETVEPPPALKERVILGLPTVPALRKRSLWRGAFQRRPGLGWGYSFAAGLAAGVLVAIMVNGTPTLRQGSPEDAKFSGSMAPPATGGGAVVDKARLELDGNVATVETRSAGPDVLVRIESDTPDGDLVLRYDPGAFVLHSFHQSGASGPVELDPGRIHIRRAGESRFDFTLQPAGSERPPLQVSIQSGDRVASRPLGSGPVRTE